MVFYCNNKKDYCDHHLDCDKCDVWVLGKGGKFVPSHGDRIRAMSDEELAELLEEIYDAGYEQGVALFYGSDDRNRFIWDKGWLKQPAKEEE